MGFVGTELSDLMRAARRGDRLAYAAVLAQIARLARLRVGRRVGHGHADLEDVVQEVLLAVHRRNGTWDETLPLLPWIHAICDHKAIDAARRRGREERHLAREVTIETVQDRTPELGDRPDMTSEELTATLDLLPAGQRAVVRSIGVEGQTIKGTAAALSMSEGSVRVAFHRGLKLLRRLAGGETPPEGRDRA